MQLQKSIIILAVACVASVIASADPFFPLAADTNLLSLMTRSNSLLRDNPAGFETCFNSYFECINDLAQQYQQNVNICRGNAVVAREDAEEASLESRNILATNAESSCAAVVACKDESSASAIFQCYSVEGLQGAKGLNAVSSQATIDSANFIEKLRRIESDEANCIINEKLNYEERSGAAYDAFTVCYSADEPEYVCPSSEQTTVGPTTTEETTTEESTTEESTTEESTTEESTTEGSTTEESTSEGSTTIEDLLPEEDISIKLRQRLRGLKF